MRGLPRLGDRARGRPAPQRRALRAGLARRAHRLRRALETDELVPYFQPIVDTQSGEVRAFEALVRWQHPDRGIVPPTAFLPICEETGLIVPLGRRLLCDALAQVQRWREWFGSDLHLSFNLSVAELDQPDLLEAVGARRGAIRLELSAGAVQKSRTAAPSGGPQRTQPHCAVLVVAVQWCDWGGGPLRPRELRLARAWLTPHGELDERSAGLVGAHPKDANPRLTSDEPLDLPLRRIVSLRIFLGGLDGPLCISRETRSYGRPWTDRRRRGRVRYSARLRPDGVGGPAPELTRTGLIGPAAVRVARAQVPAHRPTRTVSGPPLAVTSQVRI